ncbi:MAG: transcriptional regulator [Promethearchaeia archaeon]
MADKEKVIEVFKNFDKPLRPGDIAKELGIESKEVSKIIKELREEKKVYSPKRCFYALKK